MNNLSWILYLADVSYNISMMIGLVTIVILIVLMGAGIIYWTTVPYEREAIEDSRRRLFKAACVVLPILAIMEIMLPSRSTILMIAASETGEQVITSPEAREMIELIKKRLMKELSEGL